jgi:hypothetical protein
MTELVEATWRETVRDIYDRLHFGPEDYFSGNARLAKELVHLIETRHPDFFGLPAAE